MTEALPPFQALVYCNSNYVQGIYKLTQLACSSDKSKTKEFFTGLRPFENYYLHLILKIE